MAYVSGALAQPGVYEFQRGDRLQDVVISAGGLLPDADASAMNMATLLEDEQHYHFPTIRESEELAARAPDHSSSNNQPPIPQSTASPANPIDINTASPEDLQSLPGIGPAKAHAIADFRNAHGPFGKTSEITAVPGIGPATLENIRHLITVAPTDP